MKNKYKVLKEYPPYKKGDVLQEICTSGYGESNWNWPVKYDIIENNPDFFAPYVFTTEDGVDIYIGDEYWYWMSNGGQINYKLCTKTGGNVKSYKYFSTKEAAEKYLKPKEVPKWVICIKKPDTWTRTKVGDVFQTRYHNRGNYNIILDNGGQNVTGKDLSCFKEATKAEVEAHKLGFHIGDKVWLDTKYPSTYLGIVESFSYSKANILKAYVAVTKASKGHDYSFMDITNKEPIPKIITEEGDELYRKDECWVVNITALEFGTDNYDNWEGSTDDNKYFSNKENAQQYFAELHNKTCKTCKFEYSSPEAVICSRCRMRGEKLSVYDLNYQPKKIEFEISKWYKWIKLHKTPHKSAFACYKGKDAGYGFSDGNWHNDLNWNWKKSDWELADMEEVNKLLFEKASKDYPKGTKFISIYDIPDTISKERIRFGSVTTTKNNLYSSGVCIYEKGKWAEIVKPKPKKWDVGTYVVVSGRTAMNLDIGTISKITSHKDTNYSNYWIYSDNIIEFQTNSDVFKAVKWFATKEEAETFAATLKPKLMLGDVEARIVLKGTSHPSKKYHNIDVVWTEEGFVSIKDWLEWYEKIKAGIKTQLPYFELMLGEYKTIYGYETIEIGCIKRVYIDQIHEVTKAIKND